MNTPPVPWQGAALRVAAAAAAGAACAAREEAREEREEGGGGADGAADGGGRGGRRAQRWAAWACWLFAGSVFLPALPSLWRVSEPGGRTSVLRIAALVALLRFVPAARRAHARVASVLAPAVCAAGLIAAAALRRRRADAAALLQHAATIASPGVLLHGLEEPGESDIIALCGSVLSVLLGQRAAGVTLLLMVTGGEALEERVVQEAGRSVHSVIEQRQPQTVTTLCSGEERSVAAASVAPDDLIVLREGDIVPCDAEVVEGSATYDESALTGEPVPQRRAPPRAAGAAASPSARAAARSRLLSGAVVVASEGRVVARVQREAACSTLALLASALEGALAQGAGLERAAHRAAELFPPVTFAAAAASFAWRRRAAAASWRTALAMLSAATTCPLSIGVPVAFLSGISVAARRGVTVKSGAVFERLGAATMVVFDKTGTLTTDTPCVRAVRPTPGAGVSEDELLAIACACEESSGHVLARAVRQRCEELRLRPSRVRAGSVESVAGQGVAAEVAGDDGVWRRAVVGSRDFVDTRAAEAGVAANSPRTPPAGDPGTEGMMAVHIAVDSRHCGMLLFDDRLLPGSAELVRRLRAYQPPLRLAILSGDSSARLPRVAAELQISEYHTCLPHQKAERVQEFRRAGERVVMVGDGLNDAAALAAADVGVAIGTNALAGESADVVLVKQDILLVNDALRLARRVCRTAKRGVTGGMGVSLCQMVFAEAGLLSPFQNSAIQELVDLSSILHSAAILFHR